MTTHFTFADRANRIKPSPTLAIAAKAAAMRAQGIDVISLSTGEPDFDTPDFIKDAAIQAIHQGFTKYTQVDGIPDLKQAIIKKFSRDNGLTYTPKQILVSCGAKQSLFNLMEALLNAGDEVIIPAPYWVSYPDLALIADATPVIITAGMDQHFKITAAQLEAAITPKTRLFVMNSPSNPTGMAYTQNELHAIAQVLLRHPHVVIVTDDIYEHILWEGQKFYNLLMVCPELYDRTIVVNGVSKAYAMTGWRIGYAAGPESLISVMEKIQSQSTSNPTSISQKATVAALNGDQSCITPMIQAFKHRHDLVLKSLNALPGVKCLPGDGTFYAFFSVEGIMRDRNMKDDYEVAEFFLQEARVAFVPGSAFGLPGFLRMSFATSEKLLVEALRRMEEVLK